MPFFNKQKEVKTVNFEEYYKFITKNMSWEEEVMLPVLQLHDKSSFILKRKISLVIEHTETKKEWDYYMKSLNIYYTSEFEQDKEVIMHTYEKEFNVDLGSIFVYTYNKIPDKQFALITGNPTQEELLWATEHGKYLLFEIPLKWFFSAKIPQVTNILLNDKRIQSLSIYKNKYDKGLFLWIGHYNGKCTIHNEENTYRKYLNTNGVFIKDHIFDEIVEKTQSSIEYRVYKRNPFENNKNRDIIKKWKVITSYMMPEHAGMPDKNGQYKVLSSIQIMPPDNTCRDPYLLVGVFDTEDEAKNYATYLKTKFARAFVAEVTMTHHLKKKSFAIVPDVEFNKEWTDNMLYKHFALSEKEIEEIEKKIKPYN